MGLNVDKTDAFLKAAFDAKPGFSFGDSSIMYNHSRTVRDFALQIAEEVNCDKELLSVMALLHDIGKTYDADQQVLRERHAELGYEVAKDFISSLELTPEAQQVCVTFLKGDMSSVEAKVIKDADSIAFFADSVLQTALKTWGDSQGLTNELQRKADKVTQLQLEVSRRIAKPLHREMCERWGLNA